MCFEVEVLTRKGGCVNEGYEKKILSRTAIAAKKAFYICGKCEICYYSNHVCKNKRYFIC